jgi:hypothetical protein
LSCDHFFAARCASNAAEVEKAQRVVGSCRRFTLPSPHRFSYLLASPKEETEVARVSYSLSRIRWRRVLGAAFAVIALSFLIPIVITTVYAFVLAFQARGTPDQTAISHFAESVSPKLMSWLETVLTLLLAFRVARRTEGASIISGLIVGILAGLLSLVVTLAFGGQLGLHESLFLLVVVALGWLGGFVGKKR